MMDGFNAKRWARDWEAAGGGFIKMGEHHYLSVPFDAERSTLHTMLKQIDGSPEASLAIRFYLIGRP